MNSESRSSNVPMTKAMEVDSPDPIVGRFEAERLTGECSADEDRLVAPSKSG
jgi:hypothetical protein